MTAWRDAAEAFARGRAPAAWPLASVGTGIIHEVDVMQFDGHTASTSVNAPVAPAEPRDRSACRSRHAATRRVGAGEIAQERGYKLVSDCGAFDARIQGIVDNWPVRRWLPGHCPRPRATATAKKLVEQISRGLLAAQAVKIRPSPQLDPARHR